MLQQCGRRTLAHQWPDDIPSSCSGGINEEQMAFFVCTSPSLVEAVLSRNAIGIAATLWVLIKLYFCMKLNQYHMYEENFLYFFFYQVFFQLF